MLIKQQQSVKPGSITFLSCFCKFVVYFRRQGCCCHIFLLPHIAGACPCILRPLVHFIKKIVGPGGQWKLIAYFTILITEIAKHANVDYSWHDARRKQNSAHHRDLLTEAGLWHFPTCISFFTSHFRMNFLKMKLCIKCVAQPFEFQWEPGPCPALLFGHSGPTWIVAILFKRAYFSLY